jgi:alpha-N-acetylglucosamine transferase
MMGDDYLPGILMVGKSIKNLMGDEEKKNIDMVCLVTPDISKNARHDILKYYDKVIEIPYIEIPYQNIKHTNIEMQKIYAKTFTKLYTLTLIDYDKIVMIDADMIVLKHDFFSLFDIPTPAGIFLGNLSAFKPNIRELYDKVYKKYLKHGEIIPNEAYKITCNDIRKNFNYKGNCAYLGVETSICLLKPSLEDFKSLKNIILKAPPKTYKSDTDLISRYFEGKWRHVDLLYLGRWIYPPKQKEYIVLDLYGMEGKPWQLKKIDKIYKEYPDIKYWVDQYLIEYDRSFKDSCISLQLEKLWLYLKKIKKNDI